MNSHSPKKDNNTSTIIKREMKIEEAPKKEFHEVDDYLKSVSKKFMRNPVTIASLDKVYNELIDTKVKDKQPKSLLE